MASLLHDTFSVMGRDVLLLFCSAAVYISAATCALTASVRMVASMPSVTLP